MLDTAMVLDYYVGGRDMKAGRLSVQGGQRGLEAGSGGVLDGRVTRRNFLRAAGALGLGGAILPALSSALSGCSSSKPDEEITLGIIVGNQVLWRYMAQKNDELLKPLGYKVTFVNYSNENELVKDFVEDKISVCATILSALPTLPEAELFSPIAWMKSSFPIVAPNNSALRSVPDLQGKKLATFGPDHPSTVYWQAFALESYGIDLKAQSQLLDYSQLNPASPADPLQNGQVDAAVVDSYALSDVLPKDSYRQISDLRTEWNKVAESDRLLVYGGYVAKAKWVEANKKFVEDLVRLNYEALKAYRVDKATLLNPAVAYAAESAPPMSNESGTYVAQYLGYDDVEPERAYLSPADVEDYRKVYALLVKTGYLKTMPQDTGKLFYLSSRRPK